MDAKASIFFDASQPAFCQASVLCLPHPKYAKLNEVEPSMPANMQASVF